ncbi:unnamed protein product [[Candida] boidinii]|uniref:Unnamed protein product n=1 Tax=Candida boidinii TaxID=5477 RepID=A0A9W6WG86_CANBO|nr:hypothetical protein B5S30_g2872 [[Candida] boidinii]GME69100.1 unnamed protein product [[Candida] boidinii]GMF97922.1 unnamed protein product [[Candida] boidinii]
MYLGVIKAGKPDTDNTTSKIIGYDLSSEAIPIIKFFTWFSIWSIPNFKLMKNILLVDENWELSTNLNFEIFNELIKLTKLAKSDLNLQNMKPIWLILFPEVNIFSKRDYYLQSELIEKYYLPKLNNLLYPRYSGIYNTIKALNYSNFSKLLDITIIYYRINKQNGDLIFQSPNLIEILFNNLPNGYKYNVLINVREKNLNKISDKRAKLEKWLERRWVKKDTIIENLKKDISKDFEKKII